MNSIAEYERKHELADGPTLETIFSVSLALRGSHRRGSGNGRTAAPPTEASPKPRAVIVCWDGAKPAVLRNLLTGGRLPVLKALMKDGCWTWSAQTIVPSSTLPSHVSMLTGVPPAIHGVTWNSERPEKGPLQVTTVFSIAKSRTSPPP